MRTKAGAHTDRGVHKRKGVIRLSRPKFELGGPFYRLSIIRFIDNRVKRSQASIASRGGVGRGGVGCARRRIMRSQYIA